MVYLPGSLPLHLLVSFLVSAGILNSLCLTLVYAFWTRSDRGLSGAQIARLNIISHEYLHNFGMIDLYDVDFVGKYIWVSFLGTATSSHVVSTLTLKATGVEDMISWRTVSRKRFGAV